MWYTIKLHTYIIDSECRKEGVQMLKIAICDDDVKFTGTLEHMVIQAEGIMDIHIETEVFLTETCWLNGLRRAVATI